GVCHCLGAACPGILVGTCFYWLSRQRDRAMVLHDQPIVEGSVERMVRSLGSTGGQLRLCSFNIRDEQPNYSLPLDGLEGVHGVWVMDAAGKWWRVLEAVVEDITAWYFKSLHGHKTPLDFTGMPGGYIIAQREGGAHEPLQRRWQSSSRSTTTSMRSPSTGPVWSINNRVLCYKF
uniref:Uncharacterized protein n=1 Tax=Setaria italica TaxID=4555 RepID=K4A1M3_SETIT